MPRLTVVDPAASTGQVKEIFEGPLKGKHLNIFKGIANSPAALQMYLAMSGALHGGELTKAEAEVIQLAVGEANGCGYCTAAHTMAGTKAGLTSEQAIGARQGRIEDDPKLDAIARFAVAMHEKKGFVSDDDLNKIRSAGYSDSHIVEIVAHYALATFTNYLNHVNETVVDFPEPSKID
jgi:uncharacterized peroxidase-related enzyme